MVDVLELALTEVGEGQRELPAHLAGMRIAGDVWKDRRRLIANANTAGLTNCFRGRVAI